MPYKIACLCELRNAQGEVLLIHRAKDPNRGLYSPIGGKLDTETGESPTRCAQREIEEEAGILVPMPRLKLAGIISESGFDDAMHWLMFWYRVEGVVDVEPHEMREGRLEWHALEAIPGLPLPQTDREAIWPTVIAHEDGFFMLHIDCTGGTLQWQVEQGQA